MAINLRNYLRTMHNVGSTEGYSWPMTGTKTHVRVMWERSESLYEDTEVILDELAQLGDFTTVWPRCRVWFPLQFRLCAEQVMWDRGGQWTRYVTGFKPIESTDGLPSPGTKAAEGRSPSGFGSATGRRLHQRLWGHPQARYVGKVKGRIVRPR